MQPPHQLHISLTLRISPRMTRSVAEPKRNAEASLPKRANEIRVGDSDSGSCRDGHRMDADKLQFPLRRTFPIQTQLDCFANSFGDFVERARLRVATGQFGGPRLRRIPESRSITTSNRRGTGSVLTSCRGPVQTSKRHGAGDRQDASAFGVPYLHESHVRLVRSEVWRYPAKCLPDCS